MHEGNSIREQLYQQRVNLSDLAKRLDIARQTLYDHLARPKADLNFIEALKSKAGVKIQLSSIIVSEPEATYQRKSNIIAVPLHAYGGFLQGYRDIVFMDTLERFTLPGVFGEHFAFEVSGVSMMDFAAPGDWAISRLEEKHEYMARGQTYVLQTIDGILIKDFDHFEGSGEKRKAWFTSKNKEYEPISIPVKELKKIYFVNRILKKV